jgi:competence protein ComEC
MLSSKQKTATLIVLLGIILIVPTAYTALIQMQVSYIDVGQGDSILLHAADDTDILIDGGPKAAGPTVVAYLQEQGIDDIDIMVLSHADADHVGGLISVLESSIPIKAVVYNGQHGETVTYTQVLSAMQVKGLTPTPVVVGQSHTWGNIQAKVLNPKPVLETETNENSVVLLISYGATRFMFTGDIGADTEQEILTHESVVLPITADVLKVSHHGSRYASSPAFLEAVSPTYAIISVGDNSYGHPTQEVLNRLEAVGARVYRTDELGTILVKSDGTEVAIEYLVYLPLIQRPAQPTPTFTPNPTNTAIPTNTPVPSTNTPIPTNTPVPSTNTPIPTNTPVPSTNTPIPTDTPTPGDIEITNVFYDGVKGRSEPDEYAVIENTGGSAVNLSGWRLNAGADGQDFYFPDYTMQPGKACRVYTNEDHPEYCGFNFGSGRALWANSGDCGYLYNNAGTEVSRYCY